MLSSKNIFRMNEMLWHFAISGVNQSLEGNGGPECVHFLPLWQKLVETMIAIPIGIYGLYWSHSRLHMPWLNRVNENDNRESKQMTNCQYDDDDDDVVEQNRTDTIDDNSRTRQSLLIVYCLVFTSELVYKFVSKTAIFLLNPCHLTTVMQLILLSMNSSRRQTCRRLFRFHMYTMPGALLALVFPILNTRQVRNLLIKHYIVFTLTNISNNYCSSCKIYSFFQLIGEIVIYYAQHLLIVIVPLYFIYQKGV